MGSCLVERSGPADMMRGYQKERRLSSTLYHKVEQSRRTALEEKRLALGPAVVANHRVRRTVVRELRLFCALQLGDNALRQRFAQFNAPLIKRIDVPDHALRKDRVLV